MMTGDPMMARISGPVPTRREFVSCASHLALAAAGFPASVLAGWARHAAGEVVAEEPFARLEKIGEGIWALISTPLGGDRTTLSNGGLIAGRSGVLAIEGFNTPAGAAWLAHQSRTLTGRWPTHVVLTHYHADHSNGVTGYIASEGHPALRVTDATRELVLTRNQPAQDDRTKALGDAVILPAGAASEVDLGSRTVRIIPRAGHTSSDVTVEVGDPSLVFCGDLVWNAMFPNYVDADPIALSQSVTALRRSTPTTYVPGHGAVAKEADLARYMTMLQAVEAAARAAKQKGMAPADAAASFTLPSSLGEWTLFNKVFYERAIVAWYRHLPG